MVSKSRTTGAVKHDRKKALKDYRGFSMNLIITNDCIDDQDDVQIQGVPHGLDRI